MWSGETERLIRDRHSERTRPVLELNAGRLTTFANPKIPVATLSLERQPVLQANRCIRCTLLPMARQGVLEVGLRVEDGALASELVHRPKSTLQFVMARVE